MDDEQNLSNSPSNSDIVPVNSSESNIDLIQANLSEKLKLAKTPEETKRYLDLINQRQEQIRQQKYTDFQLSESKNQVKYERKIRVYKESVSVTFSLISIILGIVTSTSIPLIAPLLIILGLIKPLGYSIGEVVELFKGLNEPPNLSQGEKNKKN
jgi:hypothetical protein